MDATADGKPQEQELGHGLDYADEGRRYYEWLADSFAHVLAASTADPRAVGRVVEHGAGTGNLSELLLARGVAPMTLTEPDPKLAAILERRFEGRPRVQVVARTLEQFLASVGPGAADAIVSSNVLEHVVDDVACLRSMFALLRPGGSLALYVPARPELYGVFDRQVGHQRRYRRRELRAKLAAAQFVVETLKYRNLVGTAAWLIMGRFLKRRGVGRRSVNLYDRFVFPASRFVEDRVSLPYGLNLLCVARKPL